MSTTPLPKSLAAQPVGPQGTRAVRPAVNGWNAEYLEAQYEQFQADPASLPPDLQAFFRGFDLATSSPKGPALLPSPGHSAAATGAGGGVASLVHAYRVYGHLSAKLDPLGRSR